MEFKKKDLAKIALTALLLAATAPTGVSAADRSSEGTFLAAGCASCGSKKGQLADNACGGRRASSPQNSSCGAQRAPIADSSCGGRRGNAPQNSSCGAVRNFTADNSSHSNMYDTSTHSYQTTPPADHPYGAPNGAAQRGTSSSTYQGSPNSAYQNAHSSNSNANTNANYRYQNQSNPNSNPNQAHQGNPYSNPNGNTNNYGN